MPMWTLVLIQESALTICFVMTCFNVRVGCSARRLACATECGGAMRTELPTQIGVSTARMSGQSAGLEFDLRTRDLIFWQLATGDWNCSPLGNIRLRRFLPTSARLTGDLRRSVCRMSSGWKKPCAVRSAHWKRAKCRWEPLWCAPGAWWDEDGIATSPTRIHPHTRKFWPCARRDETSVTTGWATAHCLLQLSRAPCARERQFMRASGGWCTVPTTRRQAPSIRFCKW